MHRSLNLRPVWAVCSAAVLLLAASPAALSQPGPGPVFGYLANPHVPTPVSLYVDGSVPAPDPVPQGLAAPRVVPRATPPARPEQPTALPAVASGAELSAALSWPASEASFGYGPGYPGLFVHDVGNDGRLDVLAATMNVPGYWYIASGLTGALQKTYLSRGFTGGIIDFHLVTLAGVDCVSVATPTTLFVYRLDDKALLHTFALPTNPRRARVADLDQDGDYEVVVLTGGSYYNYPPFAQSTYVYDLATHDLLWSVPSAGFTYELAIGDFTDEAGLEIITAGATTRVFSGSGAILWSPPDNLADIVAGNFDSDPELEFAGIESWDNVRVYDARQQQQIWSLAELDDLEHVAAHDFDGDGRHELLIGDGQWGDVCVYSSTTQLPIHCIRNQENGVGRIAAGDIDGLPGDEILWGAGVSSSGEDQLAFGNLDVPTQVWWEFDESPAHPDTLVADVDLDGNPEFIYASYSSRSGYYSGRLHFADPQTMLDRATTAPFANGSDWLGTGGLDVGKLDADPALEIVVATARVRNAILEIYDGATRALQRTINLPLDGPSNTPVRLPRIIDGPSILVEYNNRLRKIRVADGAATWTSAPLPGAPINTLDVGQLDGDPGLEAVATTGTTVTVVDLDSQTTQWSLPLGGAATVDGERQRLILATGAQLRIYHIPTQTLIRSYPLPAVAKAAWSARVAGQRMLFAAFEDGAVVGLLEESGETILAETTDRAGFARHASRIPTLASGTSLSFWQRSDYAVHRAQVEITITPLFADGFE
jgi:hypothetical protein